MRTVRTNVFETNSSSIHVLSICKESIYNDFFDKGNGLWSEDKEEILSYEEVAKILKEDYKKDEDYHRYFKEECSEDYEPDPEKIFSVENIADVVDTYKDGVHNVYETIDLENGIEDMTNEEKIQQFLSDNDYPIAITSPANDLNSYWLLQREGKEKPVRKTFTIKTVTDVEKLVNFCQKYPEWQYEMVLTEKK